MALLASLGWVDARWNGEVDWHYRLLFSASSGSDRKQSAALKRSDPGSKPAQAHSDTGELKHWLKAVNPASELKRTGRSRRRRSQGSGKDSVGTKGRAVRQVELVKVARERGEQTQQTPWAVVGIKGAQMDLTAPPGGPKVPLPNWSLPRGPRPRGS